MPTAYTAGIAYSDHMRPVLVIGEVIASSQGPTGTGADVARRLAKCGLPVILVSRIGHSDVGKEMVSMLKADGVDCSAVQFDYDLPTLRSQTIIHDYTRPSAHDQLQWDSDLEAMARRASLVVCTSGMRRKGQARSTCDRALLAAEGVPRIFLAQQDTTVLGPITRSLIGRATELCEIVVAGPEALATLRVRSEEDARALLQREHLIAVLLPRGETMELTSSEYARTLACPDGDSASVDMLLKSLANGIPISQALVEMA